MKLFRPFSPPGNPPVSPRSSFSKAFSGMASAVDGADVACSLMGVEGRDWVIVFLSSCCRPCSPLHRPLPPMISDSLNLAMVFGSEVECRS